PLLFSPSKSNSTLSAAIMSCKVRVTPSQPEFFLQMPVTHKDSETNKGCLEPESSHDDTNCGSCIQFQNSLYPSGPAFSDGKHRLKPGWQRIAQDTLDHG